GSGASAAGPGQMLAPNAERPARGAIPRPAEPEARALYLRGRMLWDKRTKDPLNEAVVLFRQATERDPGYAAAWAGLAQSYAMLGYFGFAPADAMFPKARAAALPAIAPRLSPASPSPRRCLATLGLHRVAPCSQRRGPRPFERSRSTRRPARRTRRLDKHW